ncbi:MAG TPA: hypothetical protein VMS77_00435 [Conexivisphaerales archaeon]|nr:hypothetical protein [Conexivisphaerales archaeon]
MAGWEVERIVNFDFAKRDLCKDGLVHFGFHDRANNHYVLAHQEHFAGLLGEACSLKWTVAAKPVFEGVPNIVADLKFPIYIESLPDGSLIISNFGEARIFRIDPKSLTAAVFFDGTDAGIGHLGNCVADDEGFVWVNEVDGCRIWKLDAEGKPILKLGTGRPAFQADDVGFEEVRFSWIYDMRRGPEGDIYVLDSRNFAVRVIRVKEGYVRTLAGTGKPGYEGDGGDPRLATFGGSSSAKFDGPISLSLNERGDIFVGDRLNRVVRMIDRKANVIRTIAGDFASWNERSNDPNVRDPMAVRLPRISSMEYFGGRLFVPTDLEGNSGDLVVLRETP